MKSMHLTAMILFCSLVVAGCGGKAPDPDNIPGEADPETLGGGLLSDGNGPTLADIPGFSAFGDGSSSGGGIASVNKHLWRASLDTLAFLPLNTTDPITGVIATDWASTPDAPEERFKVTAYVLGNALSPNTLKIAVFREIRDPAGAWTTAAVSGATARQLEDAILVKARQLRIGERESNE